MKLRFTLFGILLLVPLALATAGAQPSPAGVLSSGLAAFRQAADTKEPQKARALYGSALADFQQLVQRYDLHNEAIYYDLGNVYERLGDIGRAVLSYRRAQLYDPSDPQLSHNLAFVRAKRQDKLPVSSPSFLPRMLFFWHYDLSVEAQALLFAVAFGMLWVLMGMKLLTGRQWIRWPTAAVGVVAVLFLVSLGWGQLRLAMHHSGVIVAQAVTARQGDALSYDAAFKAPLHSGDEFTVLSTRPEWYHVRLSDGTEAWIPQSSAELVQPGAQ